MDIELTLLDAILEADDIPESDKRAAAEVKEELEKQLNA